MAKKPKSNAKSPIKDLCQTPSYALDPLIPFLRGATHLWEPASGEGYIVRALKEKLGEQVDILAGDITRGQDFFGTPPPDVKKRIIVTNPPYSVPLKYLFLERAYELGIPFAMIVPVETLGAEQAQRLFRHKEPELVWMDKRVNYKMPNMGWRGAGAQFPSVWITLGLGIGRPNTYAVIEYCDQPATVDSPYPQFKYVQNPLLEVEYA